MVSKKNLGRFLRATALLIQRDRWLYGVMGLYVAAASAVLLYFSRDLGRALSLYFNTWLIPGFDALIVYMVVGMLWSICRERTPSERSPLACRLSRVLKPQLLANALLYVAVTIFFGAFTGLKCTFPLIRPFYFDTTLADWGRTLHHGVRIWPILHALFASNWANRLILFNYYVIWPAICAFSPLAAAFLKDRQLRHRYLLSYLLAWILFGTVLALMFMSAGPIFYDHIVGGSDRFAMMQNYLQSHGMVWGPTFLWQTYKTGGIEVGAGIADFPSMHVTISVLATCLAWSLHRWLGVVMTAFTVLIVLSSVYLGWHHAAGDYIVTPLALLLWLCTAPGAVMAARRNAAIRPLTLPRLVPIAR